METTKFINPHLGLFFDQAIICKGERTRDGSMYLYASRLNTLDKSQLVGEMISQGYIKDWTWLNHCNKNEHIIDLFVQILQIDSYKKQEKELLIKKFIEELIKSVIEHHEEDIQDIIDVRERNIKGTYQEFRGGDPYYREPEWTRDPFTGEKVCLK